MILLLAACSEEVVDLEATCRGIWPADDCGEGECIGGPEEQRWADAFEPALASLTGLPEGEVADHARLRTFDGSDSTWAAFQSITSASWQFEVDWMRVVVPVEVWTDGPDPTDAELVAAWVEHLRAPAFDFDQELISFTEAEAFFDDCAAEHGVTFDAEGWCDPYYGREWDDDDPTGLRIDLFADLEGGEYVSARLSLTPGGERSCEIDQPLVD
jgi:hypothetical protein